MRLPAFIVLLLKLVSGRSKMAASRHRNRMFKARPMIMEIRARTKLSLSGQRKKQRISMSSSTKMSSQLTTR